jgi:beta-N-acetylhexosaminidase
MTTDPGLLKLVNGVLWPGFTGLSVPSWLGHALDDGLAGVVYFGQNIDPADADQPARLSAALRGIRSDVLIGSDEEGGNVTRLDAARGSSLPSHAQLGYIDDLAATRWVGTALGAQAVSAGVNVVLGPVADVTTQLANPVIGVRSFGSTPELVGRHVAAMIDGLQSSGVAACVKHFPGHGDTHTDSHLALPRLDLSWAEIERMHLPPFLAAIEADVRAVMTAHIVVPEFGDAPATLNARVLQELRDRGFTGTIITDALDMAAISETVGAGPGAVQALLAGSELLCIGNPANVASRVDVDDYREVRDALLAAVADGVLGTDVLERAGASVARLAAGVAPAGSGAAGSGAAGSGAAASGAAAVSAAAPVSAAAGSGAAGSSAADFGAAGSSAADSGTAGSSAAGSGAAGSGAAVSGAAAFDSATLVRAGITVHGNVVLPERLLTILDVRARPSLAVSSLLDAFSEEFELQFNVDRQLVGPSASAAGTAAQAVAAGRSIVVLADRIATAGPQRDAVECILAARPHAVVVNAGLAAPTPGPGAGIDARAASRATAQVVRDLLAEAAV